MPSPGRCPALEEFLQWEEQSWIEVVADMSSDETALVMPLSLLRSHLAANKNRVLGQILCEVFNALYPPVDADLVLREHAAIFCILVRLGQGQLIEHFVRYEELADRRLPFDAGHPPVEFPRLRGDGTLLERFCEVQWMYCVPVFDGHMLHRHFGRQRLLPIVEKQECGVEGVATRYLVEVYGPQNKLLPETTNSTTDTFELELYRGEDGEEEYLQTVDGFRSVKHAESIRRLCGSYIHGDDYNILLEHADKGCLEDYFRDETPPNLGADILCFWEALFQLIKGLKAIHSAREGHFAVSTQSVLVLSNGEDSPAQWQFKFADFGRQTIKSLSTVQDPLTYCAPECHTAYRSGERGDGNAPAISWAADIWSLGCILSEAAIWIADGYKGLLAYRQDRTAEFAKLFHIDSDCFHDGERVLAMVLSHHQDIEDRLRRSDHITKHVLDSMVEEMLWEEDRPNAKALWRKAEMVLAKARQNLPGLSKEQPSRPGSSQKKEYSQTPYPRFPPPTQPLPPITRILQPALVPIAEQQFSPNVERWRAQVPDTEDRSQARRPDNHLMSPIFARRRLSVAESSIDPEREGIGSSEGGHDNNTVTSPLTPFTSPHTSTSYESRLPSPDERPRVPPFEAIESQRRLSPSVSPMPAYTTNEDTSHNPTKLPLQRHQATTPIESPGWPSDDQPSPAALSNDSRTTNLMGVLGRVTSRASSRHSSSNHSASHSINTSVTALPAGAEIEIPNRSSRRRPGFSLFPTRSRHDSSAAAPTIPIPAEASERTIVSKADTLPRTIPPIPTDISLESDVADPFMEYLSLEACLEWKRAHKKIKKHSKIPPLPGDHLLKRLDGRDHVFIVDDSTSMVPVWPEVKRVFEALSYVLKPLSPDGTELFFTISYDTWRRKDTSELCTYLEAKKTAGETNISYRLNLQLQTYRARLLTAKMKPKGGKGKTAVVRPMSIYVLTNGEWVKGTGPRDTIKEMADFLIMEQMLDGQVVLEFVSFAQTEEAAKRIGDLGKRNFGVNIVDCTSYRGNVLKILRGALDKPPRAETASTDARLDSDQSTIAGSITRGKRSDSGAPVGVAGSLRASGVSELA